MNLQSIENKLSNPISMSELKEISKMLLNEVKKQYIEVQSLHEPNVYYRFYENGREEKVVY